VGAELPEQKLPGGRRIATAWAKCTVRSFTAVGAGDVRQHALCAHHKMAAAAFLRPDRPVTEVCMMPPEDEDLLRGGVPQPADWLRVWRSLRTPASYSAAAACGATEHFICALRSRPTDRRAYAQVASALAEAVRARKREWLRRAYSITLSVDDRQDYRVIRFKCDGGLPGGVSPGAGPWAKNRRGILAVLRNGGKPAPTVQDLDGDEQGHGRIDRARGGSVLHTYGRRHRPGAEESHT
jgi:hypothetical protein